MSRRTRGVGLADGGEAKRIGGDRVDVVETVIGIVRSCCDDIGGDRARVFRSVGINPAISHFPPVPLLTQPASGHSEVSIVRTLHSVGRWLFRPS